MSELFDLSVRLSFPGLSRSLEETGRAMAAWARAAAGVLAPELTWTTASEESEDLGGDARWGTSVSAELTGRDADGAALGCARVRLAVGGDTSTAGGSSSIEIETVRPYRYLAADNHCDVTHWDLVAAPLTELGIAALRRNLEEVLGRQAELGGERREPIELAAQLLTAAEPEDAAVWIEDLRSVGIASRGHAGPEGVGVFLERASIEDVGALEEARVVLGEVLSEAGHEDWHERTRHVLVRLPRT